MNTTNLDQDLDQNSRVNGALDSLYVTHIFLPDALILYHGLNFNMNFFLVTLICSH